MSRASGVMKSEDGAGAIGEARRGQQPVGGLK